LLVKLNNKICPLLGCYTAVQELPLHAANNPEERKSHLHCGGSLKSRINLTKVCGMALLMYLLCYVLDAWRVEL